MNYFNNSTNIWNLNSLKNNDYVQASDVYIFEFIIFEVLSNKKLFNGINSNQIIKEDVVYQTRPKMNNKIQESIMQKIDQEIQRKDRHSKYFGFHKK